MKTYYFIEHRRRGVFIREETVPRFTQKYAYTLGMRFATRGSAQAYLDEHSKQWNLPNTLTVIEKSIKEAP